MPPKKVYVQPASSRRQPKGFFASTYDSLTSPENSSMVKAIATFGVGFNPSPPRANCSCQNLSRGWMLTFSLGRRHFPRKLVGRILASSVSYDTLKRHDTTSLPDNGIKDVVIRS